MAQVSEATAIEESAAPRPLDLDQVRPLAAEIEKLLAGNRFNALKKFRMLLELVTGSAVEAEITEIGRQVSACSLKRRWSAGDRWPASRVGSGMRPKQPTGQQKGSLVRRRQNNGRPGLLRV